MPDIQPRDFESDVNGMAWERRAVLLAEENRKSLPPTLPALTVDRGSDGYAPGVDRNFFNVTVSELLRTLRCGLR